MGCLYLGSDFLFLIVPITLLPELLFVLVRGVSSLLYSTTLAPLLTPRLLLSFFLTPYSSYYAAWPELGRCF